MPSAGAAAISAPIESLQALSFALAATHTLEEIAAVVVTGIREALEASTGLLVVRTDSGHEMTVMGQRGLDDFVEEIDHHFEAGTPSPITSVIRTGEPLFLESRAALDRRFPALGGSWTRLGTQGIATIPLVVAGDVIGGMSFTFAEPRAFAGLQRAMLLGLGAQAAQAIARAQLFTAEEHARADAERSERRYRALFDASPTPVCTIDIETFRLIDVNEAAIRRYGYPRNAFLHLSLAELCGEDVARLERGINDTVTGTGVVVETRQLTVTGESFDAEVQLRATDVDGRIAVLLSITDVTERKRIAASESQARAFTERLLAVTSALSGAATPAQVIDIVLGAGLAALGAGAGFVSTPNREHGTLDVIQSVGYRAEWMERYGRMPLDAPLPVTDAVRDRRPVWIDGRDDFVARYPHMDPTRTQHHSWAAIPVVVDDDVRNVIGLSFAATGLFTADARVFIVTLAQQCGQALERARLFEAEQAARHEADIEGQRAEFLATASKLLSTSLEYEQTLQAVARACVPFLADWAVIQMRVDGDRAAWPPIVKNVAMQHADPARVAWVRAIGEQLPTHWDAPSGRARVLREGVTELIPEITDDMLSAAARTPDELQILREAGLRSQLCVPLIERGTTVGTIALAMSESGRRFTDADRRLAEELAHRASLAIEHAALYREAQQANEAKAQFLAVMSHELRTPLNAIDGYASLLELGIRGPINDDQRRDLGRIRRSQHHLLALVNDVLNFARLEAGQVQYTRETVPVGEVVEAVMAMVAPQAAAKRIALTSAPVREGLCLIADGEKTRQVVLNLLSNAVKFTPEGGRIHVTCGESGTTESPRVEITVHDTGIGIPADRLTAIFDPFVQLQSGLTRVVEGTGLGLAISRDLVRGMHGEMRVESIVGDGSAFTVALPAAP